MISLSNTNTIESVRGLWYAERMTSGVNSNVNSNMHVIFPRVSVGRLLDGTIPPIFATMCRTLPVITDLVVIAGYPFSFANDVMLVQFPCQPSSSTYPRI